MLLGVSYDMTNIDNTSLFVLLGPLEAPKTNITLHVLNL